MKKFLLFAACAITALAIADPALGQNASPVVVFSEAGFPSADTATISPDKLPKLVPGARMATAEQLKTELANSETMLFVLPYGSAFPEAAWPDVFAYLRRGGNLLVIGGRPFTRSAYKDSSGWHLRNYSVRFLRQLLIDQYQTAPGSDGLEFHSNADIPIS